MIASPGAYASWSMLWKSFVAWVSSSSVCMKGVDTSTPNGRLIFGIFASIAEFERELIRDRVRSGLAAARVKGKRLGRPRVVSKIAQLRHSGASWRAISQQVGISVGKLHQAFQECS